MRRFLLLSFVLLSFCALATHNRAGEILYKRIQPFTETVAGTLVQVYNYEFTIIKYTNDGANVADRCEDTLYFGDGSRGVASRSNGPPGNTCGCGSGARCGEIILSTSIQGGPYIVKKNVFIITHRYAGPGNYLVRSFDPNRNDGVYNIPNSVNVPFYIESLLIIDPFTGANSSPIFGNPPIDRGCVGLCFFHNPGAYDPDGDSLSYEITTCKGEGGATVPGFSQPNFEGGTYSINPVSGLLSWCFPPKIEQYNLAFIVREWRKNTNKVYYQVGYVERDMQVIVDICNNLPPLVVTPPDTCVEAGTLIKKTIYVSDPDSDNVTVTGTGGAFVCNPPNAVPQSTTANTPYNFQFQWQTTCEHIRSQPYMSVFKAEDNKQAELVSFSNYNIRVVPPSVKNVTAVAFGSSMKITWSLSACNPTNNPITAYKIYRKNDCNPVVFDPCKTGVDPTLGYTYIGQSASNGTVFIDNNGGNGLVVGQDYNYLVVAQYSDGSQSFASTQVCAKLKRDVPILLNVDVLSTSATAGSVFVRWARPLKTNGNLDTVLLPGPYTFNLKHRAGASGTFTTAFTSTANFLYLLDTAYTHSSLNTVGSDHYYEVEFLAGTLVIGSSQRASSEFLSGVGGDRKITLNWSAITPWNNTKYTVYRKDPSGISFYTIATTPNTTYKDTVNVVNRYNYCYRIMSEGAYSDPSIYKPLLNNSQEICVTALDLTAPCTPTINITASCLGGNVTVSWNNVSLSCSDDVIKYVLYKKKTVDEEFVKLDTLRGSGNISMTFPPETAGDFDELIQSCFSIEAVDSSGNASQRSQAYCVDNCPEFELPNIVTVNGDGVNDFYKAVKVRQIKNIELLIFDRWGNQVYTTTDPYFKWDCKSAQTGQIVSAGTFFYMCDVYEPRVTGVKKRSLKGFLQVVR